MTSEHYVVFYAPQWRRHFEGWLDALPPGSQATLFEIEPEVPQPYRDRFPCVTYEHFLSEADFDRIDQSALALAQTWYVIDGVDVTMDAAGISLGKLVEYDVMIPLVAALKHLATIRAILAHASPVTFICPDRRSSIGAALNALSAAESLRVEWPGARADAAPSPAVVKRLLARRARSALRLAVQSVQVFFATTRSALQVRRSARDCRILFYSSFHQYLDYLRGVVDADFAEVSVYNPVVVTWGELLALNVRLILDRPALAPGRVAGSWRDRWSLLREQPELTVRFAADGLPLWSIAEPILADLFEKRFAELANLSQRLAAVLRRCRPNLIVVPQDVRDTPRLLVMLAQAAGIPTLATEHGIIANYPYRVLPIADRIAIWGRGDIPYYLRHGYAPDRFVVVGQPVLERLWAARREGGTRDARQTTGSSGVLTASVKASENGPDSRRQAVILFAAQPFVPLSARNSPVETANLIRLVVDACRGRSDWRLIIKMHSSMDGSELAQLDTSGVNLTVAQSGSIYTMLADADVLVTWNSTAGLEGLVMGKPLIVLQVPGKADYVPYADAGAALGVKTSVELAEAIDRVLTGEDDSATREANAAAFIEDHVETASEEGSALRRFIALVRNMAGCA